MNDFIIHQEFGYSNDDFDFEIIKLGEDDYSCDNGMIAHQHNIDSEN